MRFKPTKITVDSFTFYRVYFSFLSPDLGEVTGTLGEFSTLKAARAAVEVAKADTSELRRAALRREQQSVAWLAEDRRLAMSGI